MPILTTYGGEKMGKALVNYVGNLESEKSRVNTILKTVDDGLSAINTQLTGLKAAWTTSGQDLDAVMTEFDVIKSKATETQKNAEELIAEIEKALAALDSIGIVL